MGYLSEASGLGENDEYMETIPHQASTEWLIFSILFLILFF